MSQKVLFYKHHYLFYYIYIIYNICHTYIIYNMTYTSYIISYYQLFHNYY